MPTERSLPGLLASERLYAALWWTMPGDFRRMHSRDAVEVFRDLSREALTRGGLWAVSGLWGRSVLHLIGCAMRERWDRLFRHRPGEPQGAAGEIWTSGGPGRR